MAMSREEQDAFDRRMAGIMDPMLRPEGTAGGPVRSYSFSDLRRMLGFGGRPAMSPAEAEDAAQMYERVPNNALPPTPPGGYDAPSPSIPYMPSTDPRGAAAPIPAPPLPVAPRAAVPARPVAPLPVMRGLPTNEAGFVPQRPDTLGGVSPADMAAMNMPPAGTRPTPVDPIGVPRPPVSPETMIQGALPGEASNVPLRATPQQLAQAMRRFGRMDVDPNSFAARFARTQR